ncbi:MAG: HD domain-containing protein [Clostridia bacterium]|nr:HD domain-containing protein [Clostridia bacterium]
MLSEISVIAGIAVNVLLFFLSYLFNLPTYLDTCGTIAVATFGGIFPGILVAVVTNLLCGLFYTQTLYFNLINALVAITAVWYVKRYPVPKAGNVARLILILGVGSGILGALLQILLFGEPQNSFINNTSMTSAAATGIPFLPSFVFVNVILNIVDKAIAVAISLIALKVIPEDIRNRIRYSSWRQRPLKDEEIEKINELGKTIKKSARVRIAATFVCTCGLLMIVMGVIGIQLYFVSAMDDCTISAKKMTEFIEKNSNRQELEEIIEEGESARGYTRMRQMMYDLRSTSNDVSYLYIVTVSENGFTYVIDLDGEDGVEAYEPGTYVTAKEEYLPHMEDLNAGKEIEPIEKMEGWRHILTVLRPVKNEKGDCICYIGADVVVDYMAYYMKNFMVRVIFLLSGFFILIIVYAIWLTDRFTVLPVSSMTEFLHRFNSSGESQEALDENVRVLRTLDIKTDDEIEELYKTICKMTLDQAEKMRSIRRLSESTAKMQDGLIVTMANLVENRDSDTGAHVQKTSAYVKIIVEGLKKKGYYAEKITDKYMSDVIRSAPLHDVGKINIPDSVLNKRGKLSDEEFEIIKTHTTAGKRIMERAIETVEGENYLKEARNMAAYHHERWDGRGYPEGLHGEVIPLSARIMAIADVFDALTSPRVYKPAFPLDKALAMIQEGSGTQFDPKCVEVFMDSIPEVKVILNKYNNFV